MRKTFTLFALIIGIGVATAQTPKPLPCSTCGPRVPEIDPSSGANALALIAGGLLILRGRRAVKHK